MSEEYLEILEEINSTIARTNVQISNLTETVKQLIAELALHWGFKIAD